jgi:hypothetical protein
MSWAEQLGPSRVVGFSSPDFFQHVLLSWTLGDSFRTAFCDFSPQILMKVMCNPFGIADAGLAIVCCQKV